MTKRLAVSCAAACLSLSACGGEVQNERYSKVSTFYGTYDVRTRTVLREDGSSYETSAVKAGGYWRPCKVDSPGDCEAAAQSGEDSFDR